MCRSDYSNCRSVYSISRSVGGPVRPLGSFAHAQVNYFDMETICEVKAPSWSSEDVTPFKEFLRSYARFVLLRTTQFGPGFGELLVRKKEHALFYHVCRILSRNFKDCTYDYELSLGTCAAGCFATAVNLCALVCRDFGRAKCRRAWLLHFRRLDRRR